MNNNNSSSTMEELERLGIGRKIRALREEKEIQLETLAQGVDVAPTLLSQIESDIVPPTLATLLNIARFLDVKVDTFFVNEQSLEKIELTRVNERLTVAKSRESDPARLTYNYQALSYRLQGKQMEPFLVEFDSRIEEQPVPLSHAGEEFCYCLEGEIEFITDEKRITLGPGDALYYYSDVPHVLRGIGPGNPKGIFVLLPGK
ncbi:MAG: helix-turn-helix transcriptional regulator [SAR324 cluster bacterium]|nr:helix-turn-helix transcriptional regulator [SAR324 cluster bacterium]